MFNFDLWYYRNYFYMDIWQNRNPHPFFWFKRPPPLRDPPGFSVVIDIFFLVPWGPIDFTDDCTKDFFLGSC